MKPKNISANTKANKLKNNIYYLGLGTNLGDREKNLQNALTEISKISTITKKSHIYETEPVGYKKQGLFLNMVIEIETAESPQKLLKKLQKIETKLGRVRDPHNQFGPRTIDLDILLCNDDIIITKDLIIPHPRLHERDFVLTPLKEIAPKKFKWIKKKSVN